MRKRMTTSSSEFRFAKPNCGNFSTIWRTPDGCLTTFEVVILSANFDAAMADQETLDQCDASEFADSYWRSLP
jgi:hypothetical protein